jgi:hypothetical protein
MKQPASAELEGENGHRYPIYGLFLRFEPTPQPTKNGDDNLTNNPLDRGDPIISCSASSKRMGPVR